MGIDIFWLEMAGGFEAKHVVLVVIVHVQLLKTYIYDNSMKAA